MSDAASRCAHRPPGSRPMRCLGWRSRRKTASSEIAGSSTACRRSSGWASETSKPSSGPSTPSCRKSPDRACPRGHGPCTPARRQGTVRARSAAAPEPRQGGRGVAPFAGRPTGSKRVATAPSSLRAATGRGARPRVRHGARRTARTGGASRACPDASRWLPQGGRHVAAARPRRELLRHRGVFPQWLDRLEGRDGLWLLEIPGRRSGPRASRPARGVLTGCS